MCIWYRMLLVSYFHLLCLKGENAKDEWKDEKKGLVRSRCFLTAFFSMLLLGGSLSVWAAEGDVAAAPRKLIIDTDTGADDAAALILAAKNADVDILGVTVLAGNVTLDMGADNALMSLEMAGCDVPVYKGSAVNTYGENIEAISVFGSDGMGNADLIHPTRSPEEKDAIESILETVRQYPDEVEIVALGPATNVTKAIEQDPETMNKVKMIWSMGTAGLGPGNASPVAEFNVYADALGYKEMLDSGIPVTIVGLDMCGGEALWTDQQFETLEETNEIGQFVSASFGKLREFYAANGSAGFVVNADTMAMTCVLYPDFVKDTITCHGSCIADPGETFAQVIFYQDGFTYDAVSNDFVYNVTLVSEVDKAHFFYLFLTAIQ